MKLFVWINGINMTDSAVFCHAESKEQALHNLYQIDKEIHDAIVDMEPTVVNDDQKSTYIVSASEWLNITNE